MFCPQCGNNNEMVFSAGANAFICQEADCGLEVELDQRDLESLFMMQLDLVAA